jgi:hypothetical protein
MSSPRSASAQAIAPTVRCADCDGRGLVLTPVAAWLSVTMTKPRNGAPERERGMFGLGVFGETVTPRACRGCHGAGCYDMHSGARVAVGLA